LGQLRNRSGNERKKGVSNYEPLAIPAEIFQDWSTFLTSHGLMSWQNIEHVVWRRRVGLRFMLTLLRLAPIAYKASCPTTIPYSPAQ
jgi:hypothetical protein